MKKLLLALSALMAAPFVAVAADDLGYTPIEGDSEVVIPTCTGLFANNGFSLSLYGTPLDAQGFVNGAGDLVNLEFYTDDPSTQGYKFTGEYKYYDTQAWMEGVADEKYGPGDLMGGFLYELMPGYAMPMGTVVYQYDDDLNERVGLAGPGSKIAITGSGDGIYRIDIDHVTMQNAHITGAWEGKLAEYVQDCPEEDLSGMSEILTPAGTERYYDLQGVPTANPQPGKIYIRVKDGKPQKTIM